MPCYDAQAAADDELNAKKVSALTAMLCETVQRGSTQDAKDWCSLHLAVDDAHARGDRNGAWGAQNIADKFIVGVYEKRCKK